MTPRSALEPVIGLEVHCQLRTESKAFCGCPTRFGDPPNTSTCPTCLGLPGALPAFNARALELGLRLAVALGCRIPERSVFARKNYFYADLPKGYQISQHEEPLALGGAVTFECDDGSVRTVNLTRVHLEEDAGKSLHEVSETTSFVDFNRSGVPLAEIVSEPELASSGEVHAYLVTLRQLVRYLGVSDGNMEQGSLRCDCNVSLRVPGHELGTRVELKNLNSFRSVVRALEHEIERQRAVIEQGGAVEAGTRLWDEAAGVTRPMRLKEDAQDYRYFPEPDLPPLHVSGDAVARARAALPELPSARRERLARDMALTPYDARVLTASRAVADFFEDLAVRTGDPRAASTWVQGEVLRHLKERNVDLEAESVEFPVTPSQLAGLQRLVASGALSVSAAKTVFEAMAGTTAEAETLVREMGLGQVSDRDAIRRAVQEALAANPKALSDFKAGNPRTFGFLVGQVMKAMRGQGNPSLVNAVLREELDGFHDHGS